MNLPSGLLGPRPEVRKTTLEAEPSRVVPVFECRTTTQQVSFRTENESRLVAGSSSRLWPDLSRQQTGPGLESNRKTGPKRPLANRALGSGHYLEMPRCQSCGTISNLEVHHNQFRSHFGHDSKKNDRALHPALHASAPPLGTRRHHKACVERRFAVLVAIRIIFPFDRFIRNSLVCNHPATQRRRRIQHNPWRF